MNKENQGASEMNPGNKKNSLKEVIKRVENNETEIDNIKNNQNKILKHLGLNQEVTLNECTKRNT